MKSHDKETLYAKLWGTLGVKVVLLFVLTVALGDVKCSGDKITSAAWWVGPVWVMTMLAAAFLVLVMLWWTEEND